MSTLTSLLSRDGVVSLDTIEQALQRQVLEGGELDTALLELSGVPENVLGAYRAATFELPPASRDQLERISRSLLARVPADLACEHRVLPIALHDDTLVLATDAPLPLTDVQRLARKLEARLTFRIATELRIQVALSEHYHLEIPSRLRLLYERLRERDPGELCLVRPWSSTHPPRVSRSDVQSAGTSTGPKQPQRAPTSPVWVVPVVTLGAARSQAPTEAEDDPLQTAPGRPSKLPRSGSTLTPRRPSGVARGPLTRQQAIDLLGKATDRDHVLEVFFSFARQFFECTVLFALRDERLLGLEGSGLPAAKDLRTVEVSLGRGSGVQAVMLSRAPQLLDLRGNAADRALVDAIGRAHAQPCAIVPIAIRQRIVSLLYGDRAGGPLALAQLSDLIATLPAVGGAFERIIHERKAHAVEARRQHGSVAPAAPSEAPPEGTFRASSAPPRPTPHGVAPERLDTVTGLGSGRGERSVPVANRAPSFSRVDLPFARGADDREGASAKVRGDAPPPPRVPTEAVSGRADSADIVDRPTMKLSTESILNAVRPASVRPPKTASYSQHDAPSDRLGARRHEQETTRPARPSKLPSARGRTSAAPSARLPSDPPPPRTLSQASAGKGSYALRDQSAEVLSKQPPPRASQATPSDDRRKASSASARASRMDPRRERGAAPAQQEVVSISGVVRESLRSPAAVETDGREPEAMVVDLGPEAERLVDELCRCGPDEERPIVASLLRLGDAALSALQRRFPGPLWFDRNKSRQRMPSGRDVSAIARALYAFEERAVPHIAELLAAPQLDVRLCATLFAADRPSPELLWPLYQRLFDSDGQIRLIAFEALPLYRNLEGFDEVQKSLRGKAADQQEAIPGRVSALEAINVLRDPGSVELLAKLSSHESRQLSVPAHRSLVAITAQDFGDSERKWKNWFDKNKGRHRVEWLIDGLMHGDERLRSVAGIELQKLTQVYYGFVASAPKRDRESAQRRYQDWWQGEGRAQFRP